MWPDQQGMDTAPDTLFIAHRTGTLSGENGGRQGTLAIFNEKYPGFSNICRWAIIADTVSENKNWSLEMVLLT